MYKERQLSNYMAHLLTNLPAIECLVRSEYLYDHESGHGDYLDCFWVTAKSIPSRALLIECYIEKYGALYDKIPISGYCWKEVKDPLPLNYLQMWDCLSYDIEMIHKTFLKDRNCKVLLPDKKSMDGQYMFTIDTYGEGTLAETPNEHKSYNFIKLNNGQFCCYPNNRVQFSDKSFTPADPERPKFKTCTKYYHAEDDSRVSYWDATQFDYGDSQDG